MDNEIQEPTQRHGGYSFPSTGGRLLLEPGATDLGGGISTNSPPVSDDIPPVDGGPPREDLSNATIDEPSAPVSGAPLTPADPNQAAGTQQPQWRGILDVAREQGFQFGADITDDRSALNFLLRQAQASRQSDIHAQLGRQLAPHAQGIQQYLQQQRTPAAPTRQPWEAPEFDPRWAALVDRDPGTGLFYGKPGVDPSIVSRVNEYADWKAKYDANPTATVNQMVEARARAVATETFREQFAAHQREQSIQSIVSENSQWLYQVDQGGQRLRDYSGNFVPTPLGARYIHHLQGVQRMGVADPRQQDTLAKQLVRGEYALAAQQQAAAAAAQAANPGTQQQVARPNVNPLQAAPPLQRRANPAAPEPEEAGLSLMERLRRDLAAEGVTDSDIHQSAGSN